MNNSKREHWDNVYQTKRPDQVSWTQRIPNTSLDFIHSFKIEKTAKIIDIGGGDSVLAEFLLDEGYQDISVLDISVSAIERAKKRLGSKAKKVKWIISDVTEFEPKDTFDVWHDRATFHFLTTAEQIAQYLQTAKKSVSGFLTIGTFSNDGPEKCSGLPVRQYNEEALTSELQSGFEKIRCITEDHRTPFNTLQNFLFCSFKRNKTR